MRCIRRSVFARLLAGILACWHPGCAAQHEVYAKVLLHTLTVNTAGTAGSVVGNPPNSHFVCCGFHVLCKPEVSALMCSNN